MFHTKGKAVFWMDSCVIIMTLRKFPKLYGWAKGNNCWIFLWLSVKLLMLPLLFVIIMPSHNFMVSLKQKRGKLQIGKTFYRFKYVCKFTFLELWRMDEFSPIGFCKSIICSNYFFVPLNIGIRYLNLGIRSRASFPPNSFKNYYWIQTSNPRPEWI